MLWFTKVLIYTISEYNGSNSGSPKFWFIRFERIREATLRLLDPESDWVFSHWSWNDNWILVTAYWLHLFYLQPFITQSWALESQTAMAMKASLEKEKINVCNQHFLLFRQCFFQFRDLSLRVCYHTVVHVFCTSPIRNNDSFATLPWKTQCLEPGFTKKKKNEEIVFWKYCGKMRQKNSDSCFENPGRTGSYQKVN